MTNAIRLIKNIEVDSARAQGNSLACVPSVMGCLDLGADCIFPGAFKACLPDFMRRGFIPTDHNWLTTAIVGYPTVAEERGNKLYSEFTFHTDAASQDILTKCRERIEAGKTVGLSVGFSMLPSNNLYFETGKALLAYAKKNGYDMSLFDVKGISAHDAPCSGIIEIEELWEYSLTPVPMNQLAMAVAVKSARDGGNAIYMSAREVAATGRRGNKSMSLVLKKVCGGRDFAIAPKDAKWSGTDAIKRVKEFTKATEEPNAAFAKAFTVVDGPSDEYGSYKLPFVDVIGGELKAVPKALFAVAGALDGARGGVDLSDADRTAAKTFVEAWYAKMAKEFDDEEIEVPWASKEGAAEDDDTKKSLTMRKAQYLGKYAEYSMSMSAIHQASYMLHDAVSDAMTSDYGDYKGMSMADRLDCMDSMFGEHHDLCMSVIKSILSGTGAETPDEAATSAKRMAVHLLSTVGLGSGLNFEKHAETAVTAGRLLVERADERLSVRQKDGRTMSPSYRATLAEYRKAIAAQIVELDALLVKSEPAKDVKAKEIAGLRRQALELEADLALAV